MAMTHDQWISDLNKYIAIAEIATPATAQLVKALRAVIELHKPDESDFPDDYENCVECSGNGYVAMYPCQTIKIIEKELG